MVEQIIFGKNRKAYARWNHAPTKPSAYELAKLYRKLGYLVRVVKNDKSWEGTENAWGIFCRLKGE